MAWIESHQSLSRHRKTLRAAVLLRVDRHKLIGHLHELWWWAIDNADIHGLLPECSSAEIAEAAGWPTRDAERFVGALITAGFIDQDDVEPTALSLHDWYTFAGKLNQRRAENTARMRRTRTAPQPHPPSTNGASAAHVQRTSPARAPATVPNRTGPTGDEPPAATQRPPGVRTAVAVPKPIPKHPPADAEFIETLVAEYGPRVGGPGIVREEIEAALNHTALAKCLDQRQYLRTWLSREARRPTIRARASPAPINDTARAEMARKFAHLGAIA